MPFDGTVSADGAPDAGPVVCGDGDLATGEACDDGNSVDGDGCDVQCRVEQGWRCLGEPSICEPTCGDGVRDPGEDCDGTDLGGETCASMPQGYAGGTLGCTAACTFDVSTCRLASCGDGILDAGEACDDGVANSDTLPNACRTYCALPACGDGVVDAGEACDAGAANSNTVPDACRSACTLPICGDGVVDSGEGCDEGAANSDTVPDTCRSACTLPICGDGVVDSGEGCDEGAANSDTQPTTCLSNCSVPPSTWAYTYFRVDQPDGGGCGQWGKIAEIQFMLSGAYFVNTATAYTSGLAGGQAIMNITSSGDSQSYGPAWQAFDGDISAWQKDSGGSYYWLGNESITLQVQNPIYAEAVRVGTFWGSAVCMRLSGSTDGVTWDVLGAECNTDCNTVLVFQP